MAEENKEIKFDIPDYSADALMEGLLPEMIQESTDDDMSTQPVEDDQYSQSVSISELSELPGNDGNIIRTFVASYGVIDPSTEEISDLHEIDFNGCMEIRRGSDTNTIDIDFNGDNVKFDEFWAFLEGCLDYQERAISRGREIAFALVATAESTTQKGAQDIYTIYLPVVWVPFYPAPNNATPSGVRLITTTNDVEYTTGFDDLEKLGDQEAARILKEAEKIQRQTKEIEHQLYESGQRELLSNEFNGTYSGSDDDNE